MRISWEAEEDKFRSTVSFVVNGRVDGYYYEDFSDPGVFMVYLYDYAGGTFLPYGVAESEREARTILRGSITR